MGKYRRNLERTRQPKARDHGRRAARDIAALEADPTRRGRQKMREQIEAGRLAGAVWADQGVDRVAPHAQTDVFDGDEALEFLRQSLRFENYSFLFRHQPPCGVSE